MSQVKSNYSFINKTVLGWDSFVSLPHLKVEDNHVILNGKILEPVKCFSINNKDLALTIVRDYLKSRLLAFVVIDRTGRLVTVWRETKCRQQLNKTPKCSK